MARPPIVPAFRVPQAKRRPVPFITVSVLLHSLLVLLIVGVETGFFEEIFGTGGGTGPAGGGGGGGAEVITYVRLPALSSAALAQPRPSPTEELRFNPEQPSVRQIALPERKITVNLPTELNEQAPIIGSDRGIGGGPGRGPGSGGGEGTGLGTGRGSHVGPGTGGNQPYVFAPEPRAIMYPVVDIPESISGQVITIHFWVDARGRVTRVEFDPPIADRAYRAAMEETLMGWAFYPARTASGAPVAGEMELIHRP